MIWAHFLEASNKRRAPRPAIQPDRRLVHRCFSCGLKDEEQSSDGVGCIDGNAASVELASREVDQRPLLHKVGCGLLVEVSEAGSRLALASGGVRL